MCHLVARFREDWGEAIEPHLPFHQRSFLEAALAPVTKDLKRVEARLRSRHQALGCGEAAQDASGIVAQSPAMERVLDPRAARGQGRLHHAESSRVKGPFLAVNCGAVAEGLLESELFGHARGSFTGASQDRAGLFEAATGGTLVLDEIGEVPPPMQVKLLRALQEREIRRVGENKVRRVNARVLAATNRDLVADVNAGRLR